MSKLLKKHGFIIVISGPSGVGKGTVIKSLLQKRPQLQLAISATTRDPRPHELDKKDYHFISKSTFEAYTKKNLFLEWSTVHDHYYGTLRSSVMPHIESGKHVILEIDTQGAQKIHGQIKNIITIFMVPPTFESLFDRLKARNTEAPEKIVARMQVASKELAAIGKYDYIVVNETIESATQDIFDIIESLKSIII